MATATTLADREKDIERSGELLVAKEAAAAAEAKKSKENPSLIDRIIGDIEAYIDGLDEKDREKAKNLLAPKDAKKETVVAAWDAAANMTNAYTEARGLLKTNRAEADRIVNAAVAHFVELRVAQPDVYAGAMLVLHIQAEEQMARATAEPTQARYDLAA